MAESGDKAVRVVIQFAPVRALSILQSLTGSATASEAGGAKRGSVTIKSPELVMRAVQYVALAVEHWPDDVMEEMQGMVRQVIADCSRHANDKVRAATRGLIAHFADRRPAQAKESLLALSPRSVQKVMLEHPRVSHTTGVPKVGWLAGWLVG
jgi:hypothetical protein